MGCSSSQYLTPPQSPLQMQQYLEARREQRQRNLKKEQKKIVKLRKKHLQKNDRVGKLEDQVDVMTPHNNVSCISNYQTMHCEIQKDDISGNFVNVENKLANQLDSDLCLFILNEICFTMQFFARFESEINDVCTQLSAKENLINQHLEEYSVLLGNPLDVATNKWIRFQPTHGPYRHEPRAFRAQMFVVFENIDIVHPDDANYDSISPICKVDMETDYYRTTPTKEKFVEILRANKWKGYVRLKLRENAKATSVRGNEPKIYTDGSSGYSTASHGSNQCTLQAFSKEKDNDYAYVTNLHSQRPLSKLRMSDSNNKLLNESVLPEFCISRLGQFVKPWNEDDSDEEDDDELGNEYSEDVESRTLHHPDNYIIRAVNQYKMKQERRRQLLQQRYLNSDEFMRYFGELIRHRLAKQLKLSHEELHGATYLGASIHTKRYNIVPAIHVAQSWPDCAFQFKRRERPISAEQSQWPTRAMIQSIQSFGFHVIPIGFAPKRYRNPFRQLEWRIVFPKAETFLERHLSRAQAKVFNMCKALVKSFVEPHENEHGFFVFTTDYIRTHLFWECERNFAWPEEFLGEVLLRFLKTFLVCLRQKILKDFFIEERNLFESIPDFTLLRLYQIFADITANPLMHLMIAFRNLNFVDNFLPKLDYRKIFDNLVELDLIKLQAMAKNSRRNFNGLMRTDSHHLTALMTNISSGSKELVVGSMEDRENTKRKLRRRTQVMRHNIELMKRLEMEKKRVSVESIDIEFFFTQNLGSSEAKNINQGIENLRRTNIIEIFLDHLLATAESVTEFRWLTHAQILLDQAKLLCKFYHNYGCDVGARKYRKLIQNIEDDISNLQRTNHSAEPQALLDRISVELLSSSGNIRENNDIGKEINITGRGYIIENIKKDHERGWGSECSDIESSTTSGDESIPQFRVYKISAEVYENDAKLIRRAEGCSPVNKLRSNKAKNTKRLVDDITKDSKNHEDDVVGVKSELTHSQEQPAEGILELQEVQDNHKEIFRAQRDPESDFSSSKENARIRINAGIFPSSTPSLMNKFGSAAGILKNSAVDHFKPIADLAATTEKQLTSKRLHEKRIQVYERVKEKTIRLREVLNQSSDT